MCSQSQRLGTDQRDARRPGEPNAPAQAELQAQGRAQIEEASGVRRILVIDDNVAIHQDIRKTLCGVGGIAAADPGSGEAGASMHLAGELSQMAAALFGDAACSAKGSSDRGADAAAAPSRLVYQVDGAEQGQIGLQKVIEARKNGTPYQVAFVDIRMPPGWDGVETIERIWQADPDIQTVICSAYSDYSWSEIHQRLGESDRLVILKKPFDTAEICQLAAALTAKHRLAAAARLKLDELEAKVAERTADLKRINEQLAAEVEQRRRAEAQLRHDVLHDRLTSLPNRAMLLDRLEKCIQRQKTEPGFQFAVLFLDLDDFKVVNDSLGHEAGDTLLMEVSRRLLEACRQLRQDAAEQRFADGLTARLGGDEFVVLLEGLTRSEHALLLADRIKQRMAEPIELSGREVVVSQSIGVATGKPEYTRAAEILRDADIAVYQAKANGKGGYAVFDAKMHAEAQQRLEIEIELRKAVQCEQFTIVYQPIISLSSGHLEGFEALLRWTHPTRGVIPPHRFIPLAESTGLIGSLGAWVLREVCRQALRWRVRFAEQYPQLWLSVNLSGRQLQMNDLPEQIEQIIVHSGVDRSALRLEVTESVLMQQGDGSLATLTELRRRGLALAMDDFGTGYSSLSRLHQLPISTIKIDQSFVREMSVSGRSYTATVQAIIMLAHNCGFSVVAEGVETPEQLAQLQALDCDSAQGFLLAEPLDVAGAEALLAQPAQPGACKQFLYRRAG